MTIAISFEFTGLGWARFCLRVGDKTYQSPSVSYCTDAFGDLARMALCGVTGASRSEASFELEPGELRFVLTRQPLDAPGLLSILEFPDFHHPVAPDAEGKLAFGVEADARDFGRAMLAGLDAIWSEYGQEGFNSHWRGQRGFPLAATEALRRALEVDDPSPYNEAFEDMWSMLMDETAED